MSNIIYHLVPKSYHKQQEISQFYTSATFADDGFIHCTADLTTLLEVANLYFAELDDRLLCYTIDTDKLASPVKYEARAPVSGADTEAHPASATLFPHIYGPTNRDAIINVSKLHKNKQGRWTIENI